MSQINPLLWSSNRKRFLVVCLVCVAIGALVYLKGNRFENQAITELVEAVESYNVPATEAALIKVKAEGVTEPAVLRLIELLDTHPTTVYAPTLSLAFTELEPTSISGLVESMKPGSATKLRTQVIYMLGKITSAKAHPEVVQALVQAFNDKHSSVRFSAAQAVARIDPTQAEQTLPVLVAFLKDPSGAVRAEAIFHIGLFGKRAEKVLPQLLLALKDPVVTVRMIAAKSIGEVGTPGSNVIAALSELLLDRSLDCRSQAAAALAQFGSQAEPAVPTIIKSMKSLKKPDRHSRRQHEVARSSMISALGAIGSASPEVVQTLIDTLNEKQFGVARVAAATSLKNLGPSAIKAVPDLVKIIDQSKANMKDDSEISPAEKIQNEMRLDYRLSTEAAIALKAIDRETFERVQNGSYIEMQ
ncbi:HEAT repeat domain-containing protein [Gimesia fumaroli]|uniref:Putative lyase n=1 Tax=Gimesia fumaroli TaxID=2527976 RepID=A0A518I8M1_9PLAN|nr:HEAT repeat domain-containing protein [Gimesia fumaroli]QDV49399.1 putative lyase [Gimesia fumaroli]